MSNLVEIASKYIGQSEDMKAGNNNGFQNKWFEKILQDVGWMKGQSWCAYFVKAVVKEAYPEKWDKMNNLLSGGVLKTMNSLKSKGYSISNTPSIGSLAIWQNGSTAFGHIGIVTEIVNNGIKVIEGNTDANGSRDGGCVAIKFRRLSFNKLKTGLWLRGFIDIESTLLAPTVASVEPIRKLAYK